MTAGAHLCFLLAVLMLWQGSSGKVSDTWSSSAGAQSNLSNTQSIQNPSSSGASPDLRPLSNGVWGGQGISLEVNGKGAEINYDCAHGSITGKIIPDRHGKFVGKGSHTRERGGPVREEGSSNGQSATYRGSIDGEVMTLVVTLSETDERIGTFTLTRGKIGRVRKCM
jgi:hypothetical protein